MEFPEVPAATKFPQEVPTKKYFNFSAKNLNPEWRGDYT
jgi:hypothetical protein